MLGVTLFGIFLTPVFFYVIDAMSESRLFHSRLMQRVSTIGLFVITAGVPWLVRSLRRQVAVGIARRSTTKPLSPQVNGVSVRHSVETKGKVGEIQKENPEGVPRGP
jgi:multidrug efflux pump